MDRPTKARLKATFGEHAVKGRQVQVCVALPPEYVKQLKRLALLGRPGQRTIAGRFREALEDLFEKHAAALRRVK